MGQTQTGGATAVAPTLGTTPAPGATPSPTAPAPSPALFASGSGLHRSARRCKLRYLDRGCSRTPLSYYALRTRRPCMDAFKLAQLARYQPDKMAKVDVAASPHFICGLNCFEPGQAQKPHAHPGADKLYYVLEGRGEFSVGAEKRTLAAGELLHVPENVEHGVVNTGGGRLAVLIVIAPNRHG